MSEYWVDLDSLTDGHSGTELDPASFNDWVILLADSSAHTFNIKGSYDYSGNTLNTNSQNHILRGWDLAINGPWRLKVAQFQRNSGTDDVMSDAIVEFDSFISGPRTWYNCYVFGSGASQNYANHLAVGCLIECGTFTPIQAVFNDCCIKATSWNAPSYGATLNNCALTGFNAGYTLNNCQTDWVAPSLPAWDGDEVAFDDGTLFADVDTPPQPGDGSPTYTNYETDLWGNTRTGIGTGFMGTLSSSSLSSESSLSSDSSVSLSSTSSESSLSSNSSGSSFSFDPVGSTFNFLTSLSFDGIVDMRERSSEIIPYHIYNDIELLPGYVNVEVEIFYSGSISRVKVFGIKSDNYSGITYKIASVSNPDIILDNAQFWRGSGMMSLLPAVPTKLYLSNSGSRVAKVKVIVGLSKYIA